MEKAISLKEALELVKQLSLLDKVRLIEQVAPQIESELTTVKPKQRSSLRGLWRGSNVTESDIAQMRQQMWGNFPREDI